MPQAKITVNAVPGSNTALPLNVIVQLDNQNIGGELTYSWTILDQPPGAVDALSATAIQNPTFTPKKEGTYLIKLIVNSGLPTEQEDRVVCAVKQLKTLERIPAAGETTEADTSDGWATSNNAYLRRIDNLLVDPGILVGVNASGGTLSRGQIVRSATTVIIKSGLPGQETLPGFTTAPASALGNVDEFLCIVEGAPDGSTNIPGIGSAEARLMKVRYIGRIASQAIANGPVAAGDVIYVNDLAALDKNQGTIRRRVGSAMAAGSTVDVWFNGVGGADIDLTPIDRRYVVYGPLGTLPNGFRVDGANASTVSGGVPYEIHTGDVGTPTMRLRRFSGGGQSIQEWTTEGGTPLVRVSATGQLVVEAGAGGLFVNSVGVSIAAGLPLTQTPGSVTVGFTLDDTQVQFGRRRLKLTNDDGFGNVFDNYIEYTTLASLGTRGVKFVNQTNLGTGSAEFQTTGDGFGGVRCDLILKTAGSTDQYITLQQNSLRINAFQSGSVSIGWATGGTLDFNSAFTLLWQIQGAAAGGALQAVGGNRFIHNVTDPVAAQDAATKNYVDMTTVRPPQNYVINGDMTYWQRGGATPAAIALATAYNFNADRWAAFIASGSGANTRYVQLNFFTLIFAGIDRVAGADTNLAARSLVYEVEYEKIQELVNANTTGFGGRPITLQFTRIFGSGTTGTCVAKVITGTGGTYAAGGFTGPVTVATSVNQIPLANGTSVLVIPANTFTGAERRIAVVFEWTPTANPAVANESVNFKGVMLMVGQVAGVTGTGGPFVPIPNFAGVTAAGELLACLRYYEKSYRYEDPPGTNTTLGQYTTITAPIATLNGAAFKMTHPRYNVPKNGPGFVVTWSPTGSIFRWTVASVVNQLVTDVNKSSVGFEVANNSGGTVTPAANAVEMTGHWEVSCEVGQF